MTKSFLTIDFTFVSKEYSLKNYKFLEYEGKIEKEELIKFLIKDKYYGADKISIKTSFTLFSDDKKLKRVFYFTLFYGDNYATCFLNKDGKLFEIYFKNQFDAIKLIIDNKKEITKYDTNGTYNRKRFLLINYFYYSPIKINNEELYLIDYFPPPQKKLSNDNSMKLTVYDIKNKYILSNYINNLEDTVSYKEEFQRIWKSIEGIDKEIEESIKKQKVSKKFLKKLSTIRPKIINFNISKSKLKNILSNKEYIPYEINKNLIECLLYYKKKWKKNLNKLKKLYEYYFSVANKIKEDCNLETYQKILLLNHFSFTRYKFKSIDDFVNSNFCYYNLKNFKEGSVLSYVHKFFSDFSSKLKEEHEIFERLLELDGDIGYYKLDQFYCYNMENISEVKKHLNDIIPQIISFYSNSEIDNCAISSSYIGLTTININSLKKNYNNIELTNVLNKENIKKGKAFAAKIIIYLFHEVIGHIKFSYSNRCKYISPSKFIQNSQILKLVPDNVLLDDCNLIKVLNEGESHDSGTYFELVYGKIGKLYIAQLLDYIDDFGKLVDRVDLMLDNIKLFTEYVKYHFFITISDIQIEEVQDMTVEEEIEYIKSELSKKNINVEEMLNNSNSDLEEKKEEEENENEEIENEESNRIEMKDIISTSANINQIIKEKEKKEEEEEDEEEEEEEEEEEVNNKIKQLKEKNANKLIYRLFGKKYPSIRNRYNFDKQPKKKKNSPKEIIIRKLLEKSYNLQEDLNDIIDDPNIDNKTKNEYIRIFNSMLINC